MGLYGEGDILGVWPMTKGVLENVLEPWVSKANSLQRLQQEADLECGSLYVNHTSRVEAEKWIRNIGREKYHHPLCALTVSARLRLERLFSPEQPGACYARASRAVATDNARSCCPMLHHGHCLTATGHTSVQQAIQFFQVLARSQKIGQRHNNFFHPAVF